MVETADWIKYPEWRLDCKDADMKSEKLIVMCGFRTFSLSFTCLWLISGALAQTPLFRLLTEMCSRFLSPKFAAMSRRSQ